MPSRRLKDIDLHGFQPELVEAKILPGSLEEFLQQQPIPPHADELISAPTQEELDAQWDLGVLEEQVDVDAELMHAEQERVRRKETTARHISEALRGTKTALQSNGYYATGSNLEVGLFLPDFGPVTHSNRAKADAHAHELNRQKKKNKQR